MDPFLNLLANNPGLTWSIGIAVVLFAVIVFMAFVQGRGIVMGPLRIDSKPLVETSTPMKNPLRTLHIFLCHASNDKPIVEKFYDLLVRDGFEPWLDKKSLIPGQEWQIEIPNAVQKSDLVIVFLSSKSITKEGFVQKEIKFALDTAEEKPDGTIYIIPARLEVCEVPRRLAIYQWVDLFEKDGYEHLLRALKTRANDIIRKEHNGRK